MPGHHFVTLEKPKDFKKTLRQTIGLLKAYKLGLVIVLLFAIASTVFSVLCPSILAEATTEVYEGAAARIAGTGSINFDLVFRVLLLVSVLYAASALCTFVQGWVMANVSQKVSYKLRKDILAKIDRMPYGYFDSNSTGDTLSRITNDVDTLGTNLSSGITQLITSVVTVIGVLIMMLSINVLMALIVVLIAPLSGWLTFIVIKKSQGHYVKQQALLGTINDIVEETFNGQNIVRAYNKEEDTLQVFLKSNDELYEAGRKAQFITSFLKPVMDVVTNAGYVLVAVAGAFFASTGVITVGHILAFIQYEKNFMQPIQQLSQVANLFQQMTAAAERIFEFLELSEEDPATTHSDVSISNDEEGDITFDHVAFSYVADKPIIKDFSAHISKGQTVALVGPTGAGKTTLVKLLMRFYDVCDGAIYLSGKDLRSYTREEIRQRFGMVLQDTWLFKGTIKENLRYGNLDATDEDIIQAAKAGCAHHFISTLPGGYDFEINEDASNISNGEKQLLTISRAILADRSMLILDEATSSVDTLTEKRIQDAMDNLMKGKTAFVIAHRLSTIKNADLILVINMGDIVEMGTHEELLEQDGFYAQLYNSQFYDVNIAE